MNKYLAIVGLLMTINTQSYAQESTDVQDVRYNHGGYEHHQQYNYQPQQHQPPMYNNQRWQSLSELHEQARRQTEAEYDAAHNGIHRGMTIQELSESQHNGLPHGVSLQDVVADLAVRRQQQRDQRYDDIAHPTQYQYPQPHQQSYQDENPVEKMIPQIEHEVVHQVAQIGSDKVRITQVHLMDRGLYHGPIDGIMNEEMVSILEKLAVKQEQVATVAQPTVVVQQPIIVPQKEERAAAPVPEPVKVQPKVEEPTGLVPQPKVHQEEHTDVVVPPVTKSVQPVVPHKVFGDIPPSESEPPLPEAAPQVPVKASPVRPEEAT